MTTNLQGSTRNNPRDNNNGKNKGNNQKKSFPNNVREELINFSQSLGEAINDITALEVNTMIVAEITGKKFIPEETYQNVFFA